MRHILAQPFVALFYGLLALVGFVAWVANQVAGTDLIQFGAVNKSTGDTLIDV